METATRIKFSIGDVLVSHRKRYHYIVEEITGNDAVIFWLHRKAGEPCVLYTYRRQIHIDRAPLDYEIIPVSDVDWSAYANIN